MADPVVVDTNVGVVANGGQQVAPICESRCVELLTRIVHGGHLVLDAADRIFTEYRQNLSLSGQPGVGDVFMKWVADNRFNPALCTQIALTPRPDDDQDFDEFPRAASLRKFDRADRKFVAVSVAHDPSPTIYVAGDRGWSRHRAALEGEGVVVRLLNG